MPLFKFCFTVLFTVMGFMLKCNEYTLVNGIVATLKITSVMQNVIYRSLEYMIFILVVFIDIILKKGAISVFNHRISLVLIRPYFTRYASAITTAIPYPTM